MRPFRSFVERDEVGVVTGDLSPSRVIVGQVVLRRIWLSQHSQRGTDLNLKTCLALAEIVHRMAHDSRLPWRSQTCSSQVITPSAQAASSAA